MIKKYNEFINEAFDKNDRYYKAYDTNLKTGEIIFRLTKTISDCIDTENGLYVRGNVFISYNGLEKLPFKFYKVNGNFSASNNRLSSLEGSPLIVQGEFDCKYNYLTSLKGCPKSVGNIFDCSYNNITSFDYCPQNVDTFIFSTRPSPIQGLEDYPLCIIRNNMKIIGIQDGIVSSEIIFKVLNIIKSNISEFKPLIDNKLLFHKKLLSFDNTLIDYYKNWFPIEKKQGKLLL